MKETESRRIITNLQSGSGKLPNKALLKLNTGWGWVPQDYKRAADWFEKAAEQGSAEDQYRLGLLYYKGQGVPQDYKKAADWFEKAAAQGWVAAEQMLERLHRNGQGGTKDY